MDAKRSLMLAALVAVVAATIVGCAKTGTTSAASGQSSGGPSAAIVPRAVDLSTPDKAMKSYTDWVSFAYRMANSDIASVALTPYEGVRVDSYIELNREKNQGIEQQLVRFQKRHESREGTQTLISGREEWRYRYFSLDKLKWVSPVYNASYDATYTIVKDPKGWLVDKVEATPLSDVK